MKKAMFVMSTVAGLAFGLLNTALAESAGKEITLSGNGCCAKCCLKEGDACQNVVQVQKKDGKKSTFYLVDNPVSKDFHSNICKTVKPIKVTGTCKKVGDKFEVTASKIELAK